MTSFFWCATWRSELEVQRGCSARVGGDLELVELLERDGARRLARDLRAAAVGRASLQLVEDRVRAVRLRAADRRAVGEVLLAGAARGRAGVVSRRLDGAGGRALLV